MDGHTVAVRRLPVRARRDRTSDAPQARQTPPSAPLRLLRKVSRLGLNLVFVAVMASVAMMLGPAALGYSRYVILTGSMTGTYDRGSIVFDRPVPTSSLKVGDPITYAPPPGYTSQKLVTHRIWWIGRGTYGQRVFRTKGDFNKHPDVWKFTLNQPTQDRVFFCIPEVGYVFILLSLRDFRVVLLGVPALIIAALLLLGLWRDGGEAARRQKLARLGWREQPDPGTETALAPIDVPAARHVPILIDLHLKTDHAAAPRGARQPAGAKRSRLQIGMPLRIGRLTLGPAGGVLSDATESLPTFAQVEAGSSAAALKLRVGRLRTGSVSPNAPGRHDVSR